MKERILIVDDDRSIQRLWTKVFAKADLGSVTASSGEEALIIVQEQSFDVFVLDLNLPEMGGIGLCRELKKLFPTSFFFAVTGFPSLFNLVECRAAGFDDYFLKPLKLELLLKTTKDVFEKIDRWKHFLRQSIS